MRGHNHSSRASCPFTVGPTICAGMVSIGEEVAQLEQMSARLPAVDFEDVNYALNILTTTLELLLIGGISFMLGFTVLAVFLPLNGFIAMLGNLHWSGLCRV